MISDYESGFLVKKRVVINLNEPGLYLLRMAFHVGGFAYAEIK